MTDAHHPAQEAAVSRRHLIQAAAAIGAALTPLGGVAGSAPATISNGPAITPFRIGIAQADLDYLRRRLGETRWPDRETVSDPSQGAQLHKVKALVDYWRTRYDWRRLEARLNGYPQFKTEIGGLGVHFLHIRSKHDDALPLIMTHGWPGSIVEFLETIDPLVNPTAHGGTASDAFHVVLPSIPGHGFSDKPTTTGWGRTRIANAWAELMKRLGYASYVAQGGDWGSVITTEMARLCWQFSLRSGDLSGVWRTPCDTPVGSEWNGSSSTVRPGQLARQILDSRPVLPRETRIPRSPGSQLKICRHWSAHAPANRMLSRTRPKRIALVFLENF